jgi:predicted aconitase with swiveling domain
MKTDPRRLDGSTVVAGTGGGVALPLDEPLSFWGGYDAAVGRIIEPRHPQYGASLQGRVMLMARAKGSSSSSSVLAEALRNGTGPAAIIMRDRDLIVALGCIVAAELYGVDVPIAVVDGETWNTLLRAGTDATLHVEATPTQCTITLS